ncbi:hypothetical protein HYPSUDRAFT_161274 [Hypholoma sublateritium FD-334 SS-4]|uniref:Uncharacterized protein n=1 Tax=Hypholoma sublateritium (strain FD-334 SS-4) TaxID=945553 RepID=A0A0D2LCU4_HYPSF|nr:hypothetical protein HYPSUDRAFT_161274 [Hypholoma sublateritium FD-334 SS-4]
MGPVTAEDVANFERDYPGLVGVQAPAPKKRTRGPGKKKATAAIVENSDSEDTLPTAPAVADGNRITYTISVFTPAQMKIDSGKRGGAKNTFLQLGSKEPWDTFMAQLLVKIDGILNPATIAFEDYAFTFSVPRIHTKATDLTDEDSYSFMVERALKGKDPAVSITVEPRLRRKKRKHDSDKENDTDGSQKSEGSDSDNDTAKKNKKGNKKDGKKKKMDPKELPGNAALSRELGALREKWICHAPGCENKGSHCYVNPVDNGHFALGHDHFNIWAAAILQGSDRATQMRPPLHPKFDAVNAGQPVGDQVPQVSTLQRRAAAQRAVLAQHAVSSSPTIHFHVPDMSKMFQPHHPHVPLAADPVPGAAAAPLTPVIQTISDNPLLVPANAPTRPAVPLADFATQYTFSANIQHTLEGEGFTSSNQLRLISLQELRDMGLKRGEIAVLQEAAGIHWAAV